ncbi:MAG TPA: redox-sensing transcriptional repressor Rex [Pirellulales bacterium]
MSEGGKSRGAALSGAGAPKAVVARLSLYLRELEHLSNEGRETTNSTRLGALLGFTDAQVRKDLAHFGQFGHPGVGYRISELAAALRNVLGTDQQWPAAMVGAGNLGRALLGYRGFEQRGFRICAVFDGDPRKVGASIEGLTVHSIDDLQGVVDEHKIRLGLIVVPAAAAQSVADRLVAAGVQGLLNFAPVTITVPEHVSLAGVDLAVELEQLSFSVTSRQRRFVRPESSDDAALEHDGPEVGGDAVNGDLVNGDAEAGNEEIEAEKPERGAPSPGESATIDPSVPDGEARDGGG